MTIRRRLKVREDAGVVVQAAPAVVAATLLNVQMVDNDRLCIAERMADNSVRCRTEALPAVFYLAEADVDEDLVRAVGRDRGCRSIVKEGKWWRIAWRDRRTLWNMLDAFKAKGFTTYEGDVHPTRRWMVDHRETMKLVPPRVCFFDIETDSRVPFSEKERARVLCWAVVGADGRKRVGVLEEDTDAAEAKMLMRLCSVLDDYDQVLAWNGDGFDFPVINARIARHRLPFFTPRWLWLDHLALYRRMNMGSAESGEEKTSFALNAVATALLGEGKDNFDSSKTWAAWSAGGEERQRLVRYCVQDTDLLRRIEEKTGYCALLQTLAEACNVCPDSRGMNPTNQVEGFLLGLGAAEDYRFPTAKVSKMPTPFKGALVMDPQFKGITKNVHVCDFASLYPSIIITWNMSPETLVTADVVAANIADPQHPTQAELDAAGFSFSPLTGCYFSTAVEGLLPKALKELLRLRKYWNDLKSSYPPGTVEWSDANRRATAYKIAANSFYGVIGSFMSRFFVRAVAESVTQCGALLLTKTLDEARKRGMNPGYGDTDSGFVADVDRTSFEVFVDWCNHDFYPAMLRELGCKANVIKLAYEKELERVIFVSAKRYCARYVHFKGAAATKDSKPEVKGLEYKRGDAVRLARQFQAEVVDLLVGMENGGHEDPDFFTEVVERWQKRILFDTIELSDIVVSKGISKPLADYKARKKKDGTDCKMLPHIEIAKRMAARGEDVSEGTKIRYFIFDASGAETVYRTEQEWMGQCDRYELWEKLCAPPTLRLLASAFPQHDWQWAEKVRPGSRATRKRPPAKSARAAAGAGG